MSIADAPMVGKTHLLITGWVRMQLLIVIRTRANSILMEEKNSDSRWSERACEFLSELSVPQANPTQPVTLDHVRFWLR